MTQSYHNVDVGFLYVYLAKIYNEFWGDLWAS